MYLEVSRVVVTLASLCITFGLYSQTFKIWGSKSSKDLSPSLVVASVLNEVAWFNYGFAVREWPIILVGALNLPCMLGLIAGYWRYRHGDPAKEEG